MKRAWCVWGCFALLSGMGLGAQQLTRFAVVDIAKVYTAFFRESRAVREFEERSARVQADIDRMTAEIRDLKSALLNAEGLGDQQQALRLQNDIYKKSEYLKEYFQIKTAELNDRRAKLAQSASFLEQVQREIRYIAEREGYSMVLNLKESGGVLWHSPSVDITDKLIQNLLAKAGR